MFPKAFPMSFEEDGFLSPDLESFRTNVRERGGTKLWFDYALNLNRIGFDLLRQAVSDKADNARFIMHVHSLCVLTNPFKLRLFSRSAD
jgi:hypothetical protein